VVVLEGDFDFFEAVGGAIADVDAAKLTTVC